MLMLDVVYGRCKWRGRGRISWLIAEHGQDGYGDLRVLIAHDLPAHSGSACVAL
jgi:hypothetical protein